MRHTRIEIKRLVDTALNMAIIWLGDMLPHGRPAQGRLPNTTKKVATLYYVHAQGTQK